MYIPSEDGQRQHYPWSWCMVSLAVSGSWISKQISLQFVGSATFCVCDTFGNIFCNVDTVKQGRSEPRAKKVKNERKIICNMQIQYRAPGFFPGYLGYLHFQAGGCRGLGARKNFRISATRELQLARSRLTVSSVKNTVKFNISRKSFRDAVKSSCSLKREKLKEYFQNAAAILPAKFSWGMYHCKIWKVTQIHV